MAKEVIVLAVHGMGDTSEDFADDLEGKLSKGMDDEWSKVYFDTIYYQPILQPNQEKMFRRMKRRDIDWTKLRKFLLYGFSDAAGLERRANEVNSPYMQAQQIILQALDKAYDFCGGPKPVVIVAHSLGCQVMSNYIWDAQASNPTAGVFSSGGPAAAASSSDKDKFRRLKQLRYFYTTGCNIPIFIAGFQESKIRAIATGSKGYSLQWKNFYDEDDALGWPLQPISASYRQAVHKDYEINADGGFFGKLIRGWNPLSHGGYWTDKDMLRVLKRDIRSFT